MSPQQAKRQRERGAAALELAIAAPLLVILGALCLDLGVYVYAYAQADNAATAAARYVMNHADATLSASTIESYLDETFPELGFGASSSLTSFEKDVRRSDTYDYHLYESQEATTIAACDSYQAFSVSVAVNTPWPALAGLIGDGSKSFEVSATANGILDETSERTWRASS